MVVNFRLMNMRSPAGTKGLSICTNLPQSLCLKHFEGTMSSRLHGNTSDCLSNNKRESPYWADTLISLKSFDLVYVEKGLL